MNLTEGWAVAFVVVLVINASEYGFRWRGRLKDRRRYRRAVDLAALGGLCVGALGWNVHSTSALLLAAALGVLSVAARMVVWRTESAYNRRMAKEMFG
jgi:hypothetical protein